MPQEITLLERELLNSKYKGAIAHIGVTGVGKANAAAETQRVIDKYKPSLLILTGVAAGLDPKLKIGDIGVVIQAIDAEMDARKFDKTLKRGQIPFTSERVYTTDRALAIDAMQYAHAFPAYVATGSAFLDAKDKNKFMRKAGELASDQFPRIPNLFDMETSAVLQVCTNKRNNTPAAAIRVVSDTRDGHAADDFNKFIAHGVDTYLPIVKRLLDKKFA